MNQLALPVLMVAVAASFLTLVAVDYAAAGSASGVYAAVMFVLTAANLIRERRT